MEKTISKVLMRQSREHKLIFDYILKFDTLFGSKKWNEILLLYQEIEPFLKEELKVHFAIEESLFFKAALLGMPTPDIVTLVLQLQREHGETTVLHTNVSRMFHKLQKDKIESGRKCTLLLKPYFDLLKAHTKKEIAKLFPAISGNKKCMSLLKEMIQTSPQSVLNRI